MFGCGRVYTNIKTKDDIKCLENCYTFKCDHAASNAVSWQGIYLLMPPRGGGVNFHYKVIYILAAGMGDIFHAIQYINGIIVRFFFKKYMNRCNVKIEYI